MRRIRISALVLGLCAAVLVPVTAAAAPAAASPVHVGGVVPGLTGAAAARQAGPAATAFRALRARTLSTVHPNATTLHVAWGIFPPDSSGYKLQAHNSVVPNLTLSGQEYLYAPTVKPPSGSCAELTTAYTPNGAYLWAWDWCVADDVAKSTPINSAFQSTYTTTVNGHPAYYEREVRTNSSSNTWSIYLYNYVTKAWDTFYTQSGHDITGVNYGWDTYEVYTTPSSSGVNGPYCAETAGRAFESSGIQLAGSGSWVNASPSNAPGLQPIPSGSQFACSTLHFSVPAANYDWLGQN